MEQAGVQLIAQGAAAYISDLKGASNATSGFVDTTDKGSGIVSRAGGVMGDAIKTVAGIAAGVGVAGFLALGKAIFDGLGDARESARLNAATEQTILTMGNAAGISAAQVADLASSLSDAAGKSLFGDDQIQQSENLLLTFGNIKGETFELATALTVDLAQALGGAPADQAMMLGKALQDPVKGLTALGKAGLTFSEEQKTMIASMVEAGDIAGAQGLIIAELNKQVGGQAAAAAEAAGGIEQFKARLGETFETIAAQLLPILNDFGDWLNSPEVTKAIDEIAAALVDAFGWAADNIPPTIKLIVGGVQDLVSWFNKAGDTSGDLGGALDDLNGIWNRVSDVVNDVMDAYMAIAQAVLPVVAGFISEHGDEISAFFQSTWDSIIQIITLALEVYDSIVPPVLNAIAGFISDHGSEIQKVMGGVWDAVTAIVTGALETIKGVIKLVLDIIHGDWNAAWQDIKNIIDAQATAIGGVVTGFLDAVAGIFDTTMGDILQTWEDNWNMAVDIVSSIDWGQVGADVIAGIVSGVENASGQLMSTLKNLASDALQAAKDALGISSPSKEFAAIGGFAVQGMLQGFADAWPALVDQVGSLSDKLIDDMRDIGDRMNDAIADSFGATASIDRQIAKNLDKFKDVLPQYEQYTTGALKEAQQQASEFADPTQGAKFFKMRSDQILEYAKLQKELSEAETQADRDRINAQMLLINKAQTAEIAQFDATKKSTSATQDIADQINAVMKSIAGINLTDNQIKVVDMLSSVWGQLVSAQTAAPPRTQYNPGSGSTTSTSSRTYNMPIYTNQSPDVLQQSWAVMQASMP